MWKDQYIYIYIYIEGLWKGGRRQENGGKRGIYVGSVDQDYTKIIGCIKL